MLCDCFDFYFITELKDGEQEDYGPDSPANNGDHIYESEIQISDSGAFSKLITYKQRAKHRFGVIDCNSKYICLCCFSSAVDHDAGGFGLLNTTRKVRIALLVTLPTSECFP